MKERLSHDTTIYLFNLLKDYYQNINCVEDYFRIKKLEKLSFYGL